MKKIYFLAIFISLFIVLNGCGKKEGAVDEKKDGKTEQKTDKKEISFSENSSYHIKYDAKSEKLKGTMDFYFKNKNAKVEVNFEEAGKKVTSSMFFENKVLYMITSLEGKKMGMKMDVSESKDASTEMINVKDKLKEYEKEGTDEVLGYKCDVYKTKEGTKLSIYKEAFALKIVDKKGDVFVATALEQDIKIADDFFAPPKDVEYMDFSNLDKMLK
ncbi:MAG: DUF4412 domain-containing protein [Ignavibacteriae bacterium]|nr:DUF4412 domain-containing protein [Ignavibacteriota bacterium]